MPNLNQEASFGYTFQALNINKVTVIVMQCTNTRWTSIQPLTWMMQDKNREKNHKQVK